MARDSNTPDRGVSQPFKFVPPVVGYNETLATDAWQVHAALRIMQGQHPSLADNPVWQMVVADTYEAFHNAFGGLG